MEGLKQSEHPLENLEKEQTKTSEEKEECKTRQECTNNGDIQVPSSTKALSLEAIFQSLTADQKEWPREMYVAVLSRFGRMPRCGWAQALNVFNGKFIASVPMQEFMKQTKAAIITENGNRCSIRNFDAEAAKRRKTREEVFEENTICEAKLFLQVRERFLSKIKSISERKIEEPVRNSITAFSKS
ncbi:hypothetical protein GINT2_000981 [Glugoides intestinalis]